MKIAIAIDSFKGSLGSMEAGNAAAEGIRRVLPDAECVVRPLADGGEGTVEALVAGLGGRLRNVEVTGPAGKPVVATYGLVGSTAVMEMAQAAGITLVSGVEKNPLRTTTFGVGEMIKDAIAQGCRRFIVGIGGSATNDAGAGMLQALGFRLQDADGRDIPFGGGALSSVSKIDRGGALQELGECTFRIACDVTNPLCGEKGASAVYGPQKGATPEMVETLDSALAHFAAVSGGDPEYPGSGAAGGLGFAFRGFLGAELKSGGRDALRGGSARCGCCRDGRRPSRFPDGHGQGADRRCQDGKAVRQEGFGVFRMRDPGCRSRELAWNRCVLPNTA